MSDPAGRDEPDRFDQASELAIAVYGHQVVAVFEPGDDPEDEEFVPFAYTAGRTAAGRPELLITGPLPPETAATILNDAAAYDDEHGLVAGTDLPPDALLRGMPVRIVSADPVAAEMNQALHLFGPAVTALQILWPDPAGLLPGDEGYSYGPAQPVFGVLPA